MDNYNNVSKIFHSLYPLPEELTTVMSHKLLKYFQCSPGYFNSFPPPFTEELTLKTLRNEECRLFAAIYPVISFEPLEAYLTRKKTERLIRKVQRQSRNLLPLISQWRYSRKFDVAEESRLRTGFADTYGMEGIQSARALFEYECGDLDTKNLESRQTSVLEGLELANTNEKHLIVIKPMWLLVFPESSLSSFILSS